MLGDDLFKKALHTYMDNWHGKHPIPWDFFNSMSSGSGKNLNWFFNNWFFTNYYIDLDSAKCKQKLKVVILLLSKTLVALLFRLMLNVTYTDGTTKASIKHRAFGRKTKNK